ncbi:MAG TPA: nuclear transport factor 2 family protein [Rhizobacter sp.]
MSETNKSILQKANDAIAAGDHEGFLSYCTDDIDWQMVGDISLEGKDAVRQWMSKVYVVPPQFSVSQWIAEGDFVTVLGEITLTDPNGKTTHSSYCDVWQFRAGKMAALRAFAIET